MDHAATHPNYPNFESLLSDGWIPGRKVDNSDLQYSSFRDNVPYLFLVVFLHPLLRRLFNNVYTPTTTASEPSLSHDRNGNGSPLGRQSHAAEARLNQRTTFDLCFGLVFLIALHGFSAAKVLIILYINYQLATKLKRPYVPVATWVFNIGILFANELAEGYHMARIAGMIFPWQGEGDNWGVRLDAYGGLIPRWEVLFNFTVLRLISFNFDYIWSLDQSGSNSLEVSISKHSLLSVSPAKTVLMRPRRNSSTQPTSRNAIASPFPPLPPPIPSSTTSPTPFTPLSSWLVQSLPSTTISPNPATPQVQSLSHGPRCTASASSSLSFPWN